MPRKWNCDWDDRSRSANGASTWGRRPTHRQGSFAEDDDVHVQRFEVGLTIGILIERSETHEVVVSEQFNLFSGLLEQDIFRRQGMNAKDL